MTQIIDDHVGSFSGSKRRQASSPSIKMRAETRRDRFGQPQHLPRWCREDTPGRFLLEHPVNKLQQFPFVTLPKGSWPQSNREAIERQKKSVWHVSRLSCLPGANGPNR